MADTKISALSAASTLAGTEPLPVVQGGATVKATVTQVLAKAAKVYTHAAGSYSLAGGRIFVGSEDPSADGFTPTDGDIWYDPS